MTAADPDYLNEMAARASDHLDDAFCEGGCGDTFRLDDLDEHFVCAACSAKWVRRAAIDRVCADDAQTPDDEWAGFAVADRQVRTVRTTDRDKRRNSATYTIPRGKQ